MGRLLTTPAAQVQPENASQWGRAGEKGYGARHISPRKHERAQKLGYRDGLELIKDVAENYDTVVEEVNGRLMPAKRNGQSRYAIAEYRDGSRKSLHGKGEPFYGVTTGLPDGKRQAERGKTPLSDAIKKGGKLLDERRNPKRKAAPPWLPLHHIPGPFYRKQQNVQ